MVYVEDTVAYVEGRGYVPVYNYEEAIPDDYEGESLVPSENLDADKWTKVGVGGMRAMAVGPSVRVVDTKGMFPGSDYERTMASYQQAFSDITGQAPGSLTLMAVLAIIAVVTIITVAAAMVVCHLINRHYADSTTEVEDEGGNVYFRSCYAGKCVWFDPRTGRTIGDPNSGSGLVDTMAKLVVLGAAAYIGFKVILPALAERSRSRPYEEQGYLTKAYTKSKQAYDKVF
jgi:hypothetical protein